MYCSSLRQNPTYIALYIEGVATDRESDNDFPFFVSDGVAGPMLSLRRGEKRNGGDPPLTRGLISMTSWELAVRLCRISPAVPVKMERLQHTVTDHINTIEVFGSEALADDVCTPLAGGDDGVVVPRALRGTEAIQQLVSWSGPSELSVREQNRGGHSRSSRRALILGALGFVGQG